MGYARLEAEGLIVGTQEWQQRQKEKAVERLQSLLRILNSNIDSDCNITFTYAERKTEELAEKAGVKADTWTHTAKP
ncbi:MAG: hypothetical protein HDQ99_14705 [Lachnospiraceae bacterium]|nr:hypothetical protein [Lachnospiraceae bacterium]